MIDEKEVRRLLELAAKAAGKRGEWSDFPLMDIRVGYQGGLFIEEEGEYWNPYHDDGDALRLAVKLKLHILHNDPEDLVLWVSAVLNKHMLHGVSEFANEDQRAAATRLAVLRCAAAIGERMQGGA